MKRTKGGRLLSVVLALTLLLTLCIPAFAAPGSSGCEITVSDKAPTEVTVTAGQLYTLDLNTVFHDAQGHPLQYTLSGGHFGEQTKILENGDFAFSNGTEGTYHPKITASCSDGASAVHTMTVHVTAAPEGNDRQYNYDETPADKVTVWVTVNSDGIPIIGNDDQATILAHTKVTVPYFDLDKYGLKDFSRYGTEGGRGPYIDEKLVRRPTILHLYIYLLEHYYMNLPWEECGQGTSGVLNYSAVTPVSNMRGEQAYVGELEALRITGSPTSLYCQQFWGHDENLMYYRNHTYPLMSPGWGATADYILLSDNDTVDIGMYSDWNFWSDGGAFACFNADSFEGTAGSELVVQTLRYETKAVSDGGGEEFQPVTTLEVGLYNEQFELVQSMTGEGGVYHLTLPEEPGEYYLLGLDPMGGTSEARISSATARVHVTANPYDGCLFDRLHSDVTSSPLTNFTAGTCFIDHFSAPGEFPYYTVKIPKGTTTVSVHYPAGAVKELQDMCALFDPATGEVSWDYMAGSDYDFQVIHNDDGSSTVELPAAFLIEKGLAIALEAGSDYSYFNTFGFAWEETAPGKVPVLNVQLDHSKLQMNRAETVRLQATITPKDASNTKVFWNSSKPDVARVSLDGVVTAMAEGTTDITVRTDDGGKTAVCHVTVVDENKPAQNATDGYYEIRTARQLKWFADEVNRGNSKLNARLMQDIDLAEVCGPKIGAWRPIGDHSDYQSYSGTFDGQNFTIKNLFIKDEKNVSSSDDSSRHRALFGYCQNGAVIKNLTVTGEVKSRARFISGICGYMISGTMENCHSDVAVTGDSYGAAGVLSFAASGVKLINCSNRGTIHGAYGYVGGVAGDVYQADVTGCYNSGEISCHGYDQSAYGSVGGVLGYCGDTSNSIKSCYNTGRITVTDNRANQIHVGGVVGGIHGRYPADTKIIGCYNVGSVQCDNKKSAGGGILGCAEDYRDHSILSKLKVENCFYLDTAADGDAYGAEAKTDRQMRSAAMVETLNSTGKAYQRGAAYPILLWQPKEEVPPEVLMGDVNGDGEITAADAAMVYAAANGKKALTAQQLPLCDVDGDGEITTFDANLIYAFANGKVSTFPAMKK